MKLAGNWRKCKGKERGYNGSDTWTSKSNRVHPAAAAKTEAWQARSEERWAKADARWAKADARAAAAEAKAERQMAAIRKLIQVGMRRIAQNQEQIKELAAVQKETNKEIKELRAVQRVTELKLQAFIESLRRGSNGRKTN